jgi:hypothetical protein
MTDIPGWSQIHQILGGREHDSSQSRQEHLPIGARRRVDVHPVSGVNKGHVRSPPHSGKVNWHLCFRHERSNQ